MGRSYQIQERNEVQDALEAYVREGARQMLAAVLEEEVTSSWVATGMPEASGFEATTPCYNPASSGISIARGELVEPRVFGSINETSKESAI